MIVQTFNISGPLLITPHVYRDMRGYFLETYQEQRYKEVLGADLHFVQDNMSFSKYGTIRGLHFQREPYAQAKMVRCILGKILDIAIDIRPDSHTYGKHISVELTGEGHQQFYIPRGFAHGFSVLSPEAIVEYKCDVFHNPKADAGIKYNDPDLALDWRLPADFILVSSKDAILPSLLEYNQDRS